MGIGSKLSIGSINSSTFSVESGACELKGNDHGTKIPHHELHIKHLKTLRDRAVKKDGTCNFHPEHIEEQSSKFFSDIFTTFLDLKWRWLIFAFCVSYFTSWLSFGVGWYSLLYFHGDLERNDTSTEQPCVTEIHTFDEAFLFSVETQQTVGYGYYHITTQCPLATILMCFQSIVGLILEGLMVGLIFVKISQGKKRSATLVFSKTAVITLRDGFYYLMFRVGDMRRSHLLEAHVRAQFVSKRTTKEGEVITYSQQELMVGGDGEKDDRVLLLWPTIVMHKIDASSPLYKISPHDLNRSNLDFEIVVVLEGIVEATGNSAQARSSYLPGEIQWGYRFKSLDSIKASNGQRLIDYSLFHFTVSVHMPRYSAYELQTFSDKKAECADKKAECADKKAECDVNVNVLQNSELKEQ